VDQQQADALALVAETALHRGIEPGTPGERYQVVVHVDADVLADPDAPGQSVLEDGARVSAETSRRLACGASRVVMRHEPVGPVEALRARHDARGLHLHARTAMPGWLGERLAVGWLTSARRHLHRKLRPARRSPECRYLAPSWQSSSNRSSGPTAGRRRLTRSRAAD